MTRRAIRLFGMTAMAGSVAAVLVSTTGRPVAAAANDIAGVVTGAKGPEPGVWVIAETKDLPTSFRKIVVTDDAGRFLVPELPAASYEVWVRGYGLTDSRKTRAKPGADVRIRVNQAATPLEAAEIYPSNYWYSLLRIPEASDFPGTGPRGNGISPNMRTQADWIDRMKDGCQLCHQIGNKATRELPMVNMKDHADSKAAWLHRIRAGGSGPAMLTEASRIGSDQLLELYAEWTDRIKAGAVPPAPPRPRGQERNVVLTMWGWATPQGMVHDEVVTDKRNPTLYPNGPVYGVGGAGLVITDPVTHRSEQLNMTTRTAMRPPQTASIVTSAPSSATPSLYWGTQRGDTEGYNSHNPMMDDKGRVWVTQGIRAGTDNHAWCKEGSSHPSAKYFAIDRNTTARQISYYDTKSKQFVLIDSCYATHHLQFDKNDVLWLSGSTEVVGWLDTKKFDATKDEQASSGWCPTVVDTNGDGKITKPWNEPGAAVDPARDTRFGSTDEQKRGYGVIPHPDGSVWTSRRYPVPGQLVRLDPGSNPPETCRSEVYEPPFQNDQIDRKLWGYGPRGIDVDVNGVIWTALGGSGHMASFDRRKCKVLSGATATGQHCVEGWTLYPAPGPNFRGAATSVNADYYYYSWVDQFNTLGLGANVPLATGTSSDAILALLPQSREWITMRVPYPLGFYSRGLDGRIDNPNAGWKGRGVWATFGTGSPWHIEGGKGKTSEIVRFQIRPNPLAN
ncbi:MAG: carboxypeptidase regulatory-like domain-containing protein [Acidimicrobiia bacterium]|nr:carboxypeptidase regulatory-like domain-containing protein [Acidimicrobiia bacterium]